MQKRVSATIAEAIDDNYTTHSKIRSQFVCMWHENMPLKGKSQHGGPHKSWVHYKQPECRQKWQSICRRQIEDGIGEHWQVQCL